MKFQPRFIDSIASEVPVEGQFVATTDGKLYLGTETKWIPYTSVITVSDMATLNAMTKYQDKIYVVDGKIYLWDGTKLIEMSSGGGSGVGINDSTTSTTSTWSSHKINTDINSIASHVYILQQTINDGVWQVEDLARLPTNWEFQVWRGVNTDGSDGSKELIMPVSITTPIPAYLMLPGNLWRFVFNATQWQGGFSTSGNAQNVFNLTRTNYNVAFATTWASLTSGNVSENPIIELSWYMYSGQQDSYETGLYPVADIYDTSGVSGYVWQSWVSVQNAQPPNMRVCLKRLT